MKVELQKRLENWRAETAVLTVEQNAVAENEDNLAVGYSRIFEMTSWCSCFCGAQDPEGAARLLD